MLQVAFSLLVASRTFLPSLFPKDFPSLPALNYSPLTNMLTQPNAKPVCMATVTFEVSVKLLILFQLTR